MLVIKSKVIRKAIRDFNINMSVEDARKLRDHVNARIKNGEDYAYICWSSVSVFGNYGFQHGSLKNFFNENYLTTFGSMNGKWFEQTELKVGESNKVRQEFLRILVDVKRNRKGKAQ